SCCSYGEVDYWIASPSVDVDSCVERWMAGTQAGISLNPLLPLPPALAVDYAVVGAVERGDLRVDEAGLTACLAFVRSQSCRFPPNFEPSACLPGEVQSTDPCTLEDVFEGT